MDKGIPICGLLYGFKAVTWNLWCEIGIYDVRDGTYIKKDCLKFITSWPSAHGVICVTTDPVKNHIIVGTDSRDVYVFTDQMNYSHMITLPDVIDETYDITVHRGSLLVCGNYTERAAYAVTMEESQSKLMYEFTKPDLDGLDWKPLRVCTDKNELIYMLWKAGILHQRCILVQYGQDGGQLLTRTVDNDVDRVSTFEENGIENS
ncbi:hypothetical protein BSL78_17254 [Apostichopus japonicus]|uniref:Uncharacterized protein n=1 Tax=Stichopus japonicus TaxID=307972 RepID=A0A2G8KD33_STIJA|nr:hypothetical protein BSL78_17254 [Apostichopus japonicus]